jgi:hypothetical protein
MKAQYKTVKTSTGKFRIKAIYKTWEWFVGGEKSKNWCFSNQEYAEAVAKKLNDRENSITEMELIASELSK